MRNRMTVLPIVSILLAALLLSACSPGSRGSAAGTAGAAAVATVQWLEGTVTADGKTLAIGDEVGNGSVILTGADSLVELAFGDYRILRATENSRLVLDSETREMKLDAGAISVVQAKARRIGRNKSWQLRTPTTVAAVRGTVYYANVESPDQTYFCLCNGKIHLSETDGDTVLDLEAAHHNAVRFVRGSEGIRYTKAGMHYHGDEDMESLADAVHVPIDWNVIAE